ncbi:hypothetical protein [Streptomyces sp. NPDC096351]|uniref:hypothetical protein n=1 Tax=Streptomyces sp. NPDC096351 TaxID=3366087 RepID=UPI00381801CB
MSVITPAISAVIPSSAERIVLMAEENEWEVSVAYAAAGSGDVKLNSWLIGMEAYTIEGEVSLLLLWQRGERGWRYAPGASKGAADWGRLNLKTLKSITELVETAQVCERPEYGPDGCGCEDPEDVAFPRVCIEHAYFPAHGFSARSGWGVSMTRNGDLAGWGEDGGTGGLYFTAVEGQEELTLANVVPAEVRAAAVAVVGLPEPGDVGECRVLVPGGFQGMCDAVGVRLYAVVEGGRQVCAQHAAEQARVPVSALPVLAMDAEERRYAEDLIEDDRQHRVLRGAEDWAEQQDAGGRTVPVGFEGWAEKNWVGDDYAAAFTAWLYATGRAAESSFAGAVSGPVDRVQQAGVRLELAQRALESARGEHARAQGSLSREGIRRSRERMDTAHAAVADAAREHAAERAAGTEDGGSEGAPAADTAARLRYGVLDANGRTEVLVDGVLAGHVFERHWDWFAAPLGGVAAQYPDRAGGAAALVEWADERAAADRARVRADRAESASGDVVADGPSVAPGVPEPAEVGDCLVLTAGGLKGLCDAVGVRLYRVGGVLMCAEHAAARVGVPVSALPVPVMDAAEEQYAAARIEDHRKLRVLLGAEEWAEQQGGRGGACPWSSRCGRRSAGWSRGGMAWRSLRGCTRRDGRASGSLRGRWEGRLRGRRPLHGSMVPVGRSGPRKGVRAGAAGAGPGGGARGVGGGGRCHRGSRGRGTRARHPGGGGGGAPPPQRRCLPRGLAGLAGWLAKAPGAPLKWVRGAGVTHSAGVEVMGSSTRSGCVTGVHVTGCVTGLVTAAGQVLPVSVPHGIPEKKNKEVI